LLRDHAARLTKRRGHESNAGAIEQSRGSIAKRKITRSGAPAMSLERLQILIRFHHQVQSYGSVLHARLTDAERAAFSINGKLK
jgi:hypothetical protein